MSNGQPGVITLPWSVCLSDNRRHALQASRRRIILTSAYRDALAAASIYVRQQRRRGGAMAGPVALAYTVYEPDRRRRDLGNWIKLIGDALTNGGAIIDDSQIDRIVAVRGVVDKVVPRIELTLTELTG